MVNASLLERPDEVAAPAPGARQAGPALAGLFTVTAFVSAFLLFLVQPMVAKLVLPSYGGAPSVWNTAMVFFQAALLAGYLYAHVLTRRVRPRRQPALHIGVLAIAALGLPIALPVWAEPSASVSPAIWLLLVLLVVVGAPFVALSTTGPLLQRWFSLTDHRAAEDPYFLYAASNAGSFLALLGYPVYFERALDLGQQTRAWSWGYGVFVVLLLTCIVAGRRHARSTTAPSSSVARPAGKIGWRRTATWVGLAFLPSSLMLGVTSHITTDLAAVPLLWIIPLSAYLATFVVAFGRRGDRGERWAPAALIGLAVAVAAMAGRQVESSLLLEVLIHLVLFVTLAYVAHRRLALDRPEPEHLTAFYLAVASGGVLGGIANALLAPVLFNRVLEYPIVLAAALVVMAGRVAPGLLSRRYGRFGRVLEPLVAVPLLLAAIVVPLDRAPAMGWLYLPLLVVGVAGLASRWRGVIATSVALVLMLATVPPPQYRSASRTFFGVYRVYEQQDQLVLEHGSTIHGREWLDPGRRGEPIGYYARQSPIGEVFAALGPTLHDVSVVGLGVGTLAAYGEPDRRLTFYEIDPEMVRIAKEDFHYLGDSRSPIDYVVGDGRLALDRAPAGVTDLVVLDAFSSDAIPVHLLTRQAVEVYLARLTPGGAIAFHISNNHLDLAPVLAGIAHDLGLTGLVATDEAGDTASGRLPSQWVVLAPDATTLGPLAGTTGWRDLSELPRQTWTDDSSNLLAVLR